MMEDFVIFAVGCLVGKRLWDKAFNSLWMERLMLEKKKEVDEYYERLKEQSDLPFDANVCLRLPRYLHLKLKKAAEANGLSLNEYASRRLLEELEKK